MLLLKQWLNTISGASPTILALAKEKQTGRACFSERMRSTWRGSMCQGEEHIADRECTGKTWVACG